MLMGLWRQDLVDEISEHIDRTRQEAWGVPDLSSNVFKGVSQQLSVLYDRWPTVDNSSGADELVKRGGLVDKSGLWTTMARFQETTIGLRENLMHVHASREGDILYRPVVPDRVVAWSKPETPDVPSGLAELRIRSRDRKQIWAWDVLDITNPDNPSWRVLEPNGPGRVVLPADGNEVEFSLFGTDVSDEFIIHNGVRGARVGKDYPSRFSDGEPFLPYTLFHASQTGDSLWDPWEWLEVVRGSMTAAVLYTFFVHCVRDCSWPQRWAINLILQGAGVDSAGEKGRRKSIPTDPSSLLMFETLDDLQGLLGQFEPGADPEKLAESISGFEQRVAVYAGVAPADIQRTSSQARSGYAIAITNAGKREAQRRFAPQFRRGDLNNMAITAALLNRATGSTFPEAGYNIRYPTIPLSAEEMKALREDVLEKLDRNLISLVDAHMVFNPGITRETAIKELQRVKLENALIDNAEIIAAARGAA